MQQTEQAMGWGGAERTRVEAVVETLATLRSAGESLADVAHDARNMVTALGLYCDLLEAPGVLATPYEHYGNELKMVAAASRRLVERLATLNSNEHPGGRDNGLERGSLSWMEAVPSQSRSENYWALTSPVPVGNLAEELRLNRNL